MKRSERSVKNQKNYTKHKGFTLVELIVVIVILAILAAILIPGLLKWIDQAKKKQYELEARNIYLATEASLVELHARGFEGTGLNEASKGKPWDLTGIKKNYLTFESGRNGKMLEYVENMSGTDIEYIRCYIHEGKLKALAIKYTSSDTKTIQATIKEKDCNDESLELKGPDSNWTWSDDGTWSIKVVP